MPLAYGPPRCADCGREIRNGATRCRDCRPAHDRAMRQRSMQAWYARNAARVRQARKVRPATRKEAR